MERPGRHTDLTPRGIIRDARDRVGGQPLNSARPARTRRIGTQMTSTAKRCAVLVLLGVMAVGSTYWGWGYLPT